MARRIRVEYPGAINHVRNGANLNRVRSPDPGFPGYVANSPLVSQITFKQSTTTRMTTTKNYDYLDRLTSISSVPASQSGMAILRGGQIFYVTGLPECVCCSAARSWAAH